MLSYSSSTSLPKTSCAQSEDSAPIITPNGDAIWYNLGVLHRTSGPAIIRSTGDRIWYCHGNVHREDGPAVEYSNGNAAWYLHGELHRATGPAIEYHDNTRAWYLHGKNYTDMQTFCDSADLSGVEKTLFILKWYF